MDFREKADKAQKELKQHWLSYVLFAVIAGTAIWQAVTYLQKETYEWKLNRAEREKEELKAQLSALKPKKSIGAPSAASGAGSTINTYDPCDTGECTEYFPPIPGAGKDCCWLYLGRYTTKSGQLVQHSEDTPITPEGRTPYAGDVYLVKNDLTLRNKVVSQRFLVDGVTFEGAVAIVPKGTKVRVEETHQLGLMPFAVYGRVTIFGATRPVL